METVFYSLATKSNFNKALNHFFKVNDVVDELENRKNLCDLINEDIDSGDMLPGQVLPIIGAVVRDKYQYSYDSYNIPVTVSEFEKIAEETSKWTALDIVMVYYSPRGNVVLINPKNLHCWENARELTRDQLIVIYAKFLKGDDCKIEKEAITAIEEMIAGKDVFINKEFIDQTVAPQKPRKPVEQRTSSSKTNITPKYAVQVSNELFHNGNVEAWKKIIESYNVKFPNLEVHIFFEGEMINDINALFKWGKVKHGDSILFQVSGDDIRGVSKLQKYLYEGASQRYEQFLKIGVGQVLNLF